MVIHRADNNARVPALSRLVQTQKVQPIVGQHRAVFTLRELKDFCVWDALIGTACIY